MPNVLRGNSAAALHFLGMIRPRIGTLRMPLPPIVNKLLDVAIAIALTAGLVCLVVVLNSLLTSPKASWAGFKLWYTFILRPDILGMMILTALVTTGYFMWQQQRPRSR